MPYYKMLYNKLNKIKEIIYLLSPSYWLYQSLKCKNECNDKNDINKDIANIIKILYLCLSITIFIMFSGFDLKKIILANEYRINYSQILFILITILIPMIIISNLLKLYKVFLEKRTEYLKSYSKIKYLFLKNLSLFIVLISIFTLFILVVDSRIFKLTSKIEKITLILLILFYGVSRIIHFFVVFIPDIIRKVETGEKREGKGVVRLSLLAVFSYLNLIIDYTILFYALNIYSNKYLHNVIMFNNDISTIMDMLYYTISSDTISANYFLAKFYIIILNISITLIITGNLAVYLGMKKDENSNYNYKNNK